MALPQAWQAHGAHRQQLWCDHFCNSGFIQVCLRGLHCSSYSLAFLSDVHQVFFFLISFHLMCLQAGWVGPPSPPPLQRWQRWTASSMSWSTQRGSASAWESLRPSRWPQRSFHFNKPFPFTQVWCRCQRGSLWQVKALNSLSGHRLMPETTSQNTVHMKVLQSLWPSLTSYFYLTVPLLTLSTGDDGDPLFSRPRDLDLIQSVPPVDLLNMKAPPRVLTLSEQPLDSLETDQTASSQSNPSQTVSVNQGFHLVSLLSLITMIWMSNLTLCSQHKCTSFPSQKLHFYCKYS